MPGPSERSIESVGLPVLPVLVDALVTLPSLLVGASNVEAFLTEVARLAAGVVPAASCGITMRRDGRPLTVASSDERAERVDEVQYGAGEGPCLDALRTGVPVEVADLTAERRWATYRPHALEHGVRCSLSLPLTAGTAPVGAMNLYGFVPQAFDAAARRHAETFAVQASTALTLLLRALGLAQDSADLEQALASRSVIDQALGILMAQQRCNADQAFVLLRAHSQHNNRKLRDVATDLITRVTGEPPVPVHGFHRGRTAVVEPRDRETGGPAGSGPNRRGLDTEGH
jgi:GAF domain-containing protein